MQFEVEIAGRVRQVVATRTGDGFAMTVDGRPFHVDAVRIDPYTLSLLVDSVHSREVVITPDPASSAGSPVTIRVGAAPIVATLNGRRRGARSSGTAAASGPQRIVAPMPGKVVRVPVAAGDTVRAGQPLVVVEAMKMENELRAGRDGTVADVQAREGMSVEAGTLLVVVR
jgi:biotin carboxyl carrier protein